MIQSKGMIIEFNMADDNGSLCMHVCSYTLKSVIFAIG